MCYDISFHTKLELITKYLPEIQFLTNQPLTFDSIFHVQGHAYGLHPIVVQDASGIKLVSMEWGVIAGYMNTPDKIKKMRPLMLNARSEKVLDKTSYWYRIRKNRCLIPMNGFFEHREIAGIKNKVPYHITVKEHDLFFVAGFYAYAPVPDPETGELVGTFCILTRNANTLMDRIHNGGPNKGRMPLILDHEMIRDWLNPNMTDTDLQHMLDFEFPAERMDAWPVKQIRGKSHPNEACVIEPAEAIWQGLPGIYEEPVKKEAASLF